MMTEEKIRMQIRMCSTRVYPSSLRHQALEFGFKFPLKTLSVLYNYDSCNIMWMELMVEKMELKSLLE